MTFVSGAVSMDARVDIEEALDAKSGCRGTFAEFGQTITVDERLLKVG
jgi:hypothetical protein